MPEVLLPLMTNGPGEAPLFVPTLMASEWMFSTATGEEGAVQGSSKCPQPEVRADDGGCSRTSNGGLDSMRIFLNPPSETHSGAIESDSIPRVR